MKPGLSSYENDIDGGVDSIKQLLTHAERTIPQAKWAATPLELKATAGLRLLPEEKANAILDGTRDLLRNSGFKGTSSEFEMFQFKYFQSVTMPSKSWRAMTRASTHG